MVSAIITARQISCNPLNCGPGVDTARFNARLDEVTITRKSDGRVTVTHNNGGAQGTDLLINIEILRLADQEVLLDHESVSNTSLFHEAFYLKHNADVANAVTSGMYSSGLQHFQNNGMAEGRDPSPWFDSSAYLERHMDVALAAH